jgi:hypothetical protein
MLSVKPSLLLVALLMAISSQSAFSVENRKKQNSNKTPPTMAVAKVEKVFSVRDGDFLSIHYLITWQGQLAIVEDPINSTNYKEGEEVSFLISRHDMRTSSRPNAPATISFHALPF